MTTEREASPPAADLSRRDALLLSLLPSAVLPLLIALPVHQLWGGLRWDHHPMHALAEGIGAFAALLLAGVIVVMRSNGQVRPLYLWVATSLTTMGLLDGIHAGLHAGAAFVWLHCLATLAGGLAFALVVLPAAVSARPRLQRAPLFGAVIATLLAIVVLLYAEAVPAVAAEGMFTPLAEALNLLGGAGFLVAWFHFAWRDRSGERRERLLLANHCLLFGMAAMLFHFSVLWDVTWWLWHGLRLTAYLVILQHFLGLYVANVGRMRDNEAALNARSEELRRTRNRLGDIIENSPSVITLKDTDGRYVMVNRRFEQVFDAPATAVLGKTAAEAFPASSEIADDGADAIVVSLAQPTQREQTVNLADGAHTFITARFPLVGEDGHVYGVGCIQTDISDRKAAEQRLRLAQKIIDNASEAVIVTDPTGRVLDVNAAYTRITGYLRDEVIGSVPGTTCDAPTGSALYARLPSLLGASGRWAGEVWDRRRSGEPFPAWISLNAIRDGDGAVSHCVGMFKDITAEKDTEKQLRDLAFFDPLTGLANRTFFRERLNEAVIASRRHGDRVALLFIDMDRFKDVNDTLGHEAGDELIIQAADRIRASLRDTDTVARLGGDEFTIILTEVDNAESAGQVAQHIIERLHEPFTLFGNEVVVGASIGISVFPDDGADGDALVKNADTAMYHAKDCGRGNFQFFQAEMNERMLRRVTLERDLRRALEREEFVLYYQPKYDLASARLVGVEALVRWQHPERGLLAPGEFVPLAEERNLIVPLGRWVLATACRQVKHWERAGLGMHPLAVNLSSRQFQQTDLLRQVHDTLYATHLDPGLLELEITESVLMERPDETADLLERLRAMGVRIAIDDFGTGYSSLAYLKRFAVDTLKIDRSFVSDLPGDRGDVSIVDSIIALATARGINVVAEGVETPAQRDFLRARGCRQAQGFLFSRPLPNAEMEAVLHAAAEILQPDTARAS